MNADLPTITTSTYGRRPTPIATTYTVAGDRETPEEAMQLRAIRAHFKGVAESADTNSFTSYFSDSATTQPTRQMIKRIVRVYLADTDENVPLDKSILHQTEEKLTDLTDQELFFEMPVQEVLTKHNALRVTLLDKKATTRSGRDTFLEPVKIRDLKMTVLNVATF